MPAIHRTLFRIIFLTLLLGGCFQSVQSQVFCKRNVRVDPIGFPLQYWGIHHRVKQNLRTDTASFLQQLAQCNDSATHNHEVCVHNRFLFADFVLYYQLTKRYKPGDISVPDFELSLAHVRDSLYSQWMTSIQSASMTGYFEWESTDVSALSHEEFVSLGSQNFTQLERLSGLANPAPKQRDSAAYFVYHTLNGRTPFSSIFPSLSHALANDPAMLQNLHCLERKMLRESDTLSLFDKASVCTVNEKKALLMLGALMSQRMYLLRDWKAWIDQQQDSTQAMQMAAVIMAASTLHFRMETLGREKGAELLFPAELHREHGSTKAYHFWSTALLGYKLAEAGFERTVAIEAATKPARRYKRFIQVPGLAFNVLLLRPLVSGTTADYRRVVYEQYLGAEWGYDLYSKK